MTNIYRVKSSQRGVALLEATIAIPFFIIIFAAIMSLAPLYVAKIRMMSIARERVWTFAMGGCGETGDARLPSSPMPPDITTNDEGPPANANGPLDLGDTSHTSSDPQTALMSRSFGSTIATVQKSVGSDRLLGGATYKITGTMKLMCNEIPYNSNPLGLLHSAFHSMSSW